jgi:hypothetical protein
MGRQLLHGGAKVRLFVTLTVTTLLGVLGSECSAEVTGLFTPAFVVLATSVGSTRWTLAAWVVHPASTENHLALFLAQATINTVVFDLARDL